jgi:hypothetical protein
MSKRFPNKFERSERDFYATPLQSVAPLIPHLMAAGVRTFCEPCAGNDDLVRYLDSFGLRCLSSGDIARGQDALQVVRFDAPVISTRHSPGTSCCRCLSTSLLPRPRHGFSCLPISRMSSRNDRPYLSRCMAIVTAGSGALVRRQRNGECFLVPIHARLQSRPSLLQRAIQLPRASPSARNAASPSSRLGPTQRPVRTVAGSACNGGVPLTVAHP